MGEAGLNEKFPLRVGGEGRVEMPSGRLSLMLDRAVSEAVKLLLTGTRLVLAAINMPLMLGRDVLD